MSYYQVALTQFEEIINLIINDKVKSRYKDDLLKIYLNLFAINYLINRIELKKKFDSDYMKITFACSLESFLLVLNNYPRGSLLVFRSAIESFAKCIIETIDSEKEYIIDDRAYSKNKSTITKIIEKQYTGKLLEEGLSLNGKMEKNYKTLSALSHSLVAESKENIISFFSEADEINIPAIESCLSKLKEGLDLIYSWMIILSKNSMIEWEKDVVFKLLKLVFGNSKSKTYLKLIKNNED